ncbi:MAG: HAMP domain-containing sensor histidine kinase [Bacillota bacterium]|nr:HAMP domain-containing sensor histidine kinase [Bacillota bacterium]
MIKKLRKKLIFVSMLSLFIVLFALILSIGILNYRKLVADADHVLSILAENNGRFPEREMQKEPPKPEKNFPEKNLFFSPELPYETRYFSAVVNEESEVLSAETGKIATVDEETITEYVQEIWEKGKQKGFIENYRFLWDRSNGEMRIIFLDCGRSLNTFRMFLFIAAFVSFFGFLAVFLLMIFLSAYIVKPFLENYEKQKRFITDAGHELKTPLTIIDADAAVLEMDLGENEWLSDIQNQTKRLTDLTNNLILLARMEEENMKLPMVEFPLSDIAEEVMGNFQTMAKAQNKILHGKIQPMISMSGDEKAIRQLMGILLENAVKYSDEKGEILLTVETQRNHIFLSVFNTTEFISKKEIAHLFERFYRTDKSRNSQTGGHGIGLSIAATTVRAHKGKISAITEDEKSLKITAVFPNGKK